jgi:2-oxoglutarate ferredoxin oxidoreductase subunit delta
LIPSGEAGFPTVFRIRLTPKDRSSIQRGAYRRNTPSSDLDRAGRHMAKPKLKEHVINRDWCKGCGICVHFCPKKVLELDENDKVVAARPQDCVCCKLCELRCPDLAIEVRTEQE